jgi:adenine deaminase
MMSMEELIETCLGRVPADLQLHGDLLNVYTGGIQEAYVAIKGGRIAYVGSKPLKALREMEVEGVILPAYIDGHLHIESSLMIPSSFAEAVVPRGTGCVIIDPHEVANILGLEGVRFMVQDAKRTPLKVYVMAPSCVPATHLETSGAELGVEELKELRKIPEVIGLGEMMNYPGVLNLDETALSKLRAFSDIVIDGHAPGLKGASLSAYLSAGIGSDHECITYVEALEKVSLGMWIMIREGSASKNLKALAPLARRGYRRLMLVSDDIHAEDILSIGHMDRCLRRAVEEGIDPIEAVRMATLNPSEYFGLRHLGGVSPGKSADLVVVNNLGDFEAELVILDGDVAARKGRYLAGVRGGLPEAAMRRTVRMPEATPERVEIRYEGEEALVRVIGVVEDEIYTESFTHVLNVEEGVVKPDVEADILKVCVFERHRGSGRIGKGFVKGFGLKAGAIASTIAHDSHNLIALGVTDGDICTAANRLRELNGGLIVVEDGEVRAELPLPIAGLMSTMKAEEVAQVVEHLHREAERLGCELRSPFMKLSFLALPVIPMLRITDYGLVDVELFKVVDLFLPST